MWSPMTKEDKNQVIILFTVRDVFCIMCDWPGDINPFTAGLWRHKLPERWIIIFLAEKK